jgi:hypothetical protein
MYQSLRHNLLLLLSEDNLVQKLATRGGNLRLIEVEEKN